MKVIHVSKNVVDVFWGAEGWEPHTRVHIARNPDKSVTFSHISGTKLPPKQKSQLARIVSK